MQFLTVGKKYDQSVNFKCLFWLVVLQIEFVEFTPLRMHRNKKNNKKNKQTGNEKWKMKAKCLNFNDCFNRLQTLQ